MTKNRAALKLFVAILTLTLPAVTAEAQAQRPTAAQKAGSITALLPTAKIERRIGRQLTSLDAKKGDEVIWNDVVETAKGGRARITLNNQSILSLGSQAKLTIVRHDARSQQTQLQLAYGRIRAEVASVTRDGGRFELRTPTAVAGVIGTDFGTSSSVGLTSFLCISGMVNVSNSDANVPGTVPCAPGMATDVSTGQPPTPPRPATQQEIQQLIQDTEPAVISSIIPNSLLPGQTLASTVAGSRLAGINAVAVTGEGVTASMSNIQAESIALSLTAAATATAGPRTITFTDAQGRQTVAVITVLAPPGAGADFEAIKKTYVDAFITAAQSGIAGLNSIGLALQQSVEQGGTQINTANQLLPRPLTLSEVDASFAQIETAMLEALKAAGGQITEADQALIDEFSASFEAARLALLERDPSGTPDDTFRAAVNDAFNRMNEAFNARLLELHRAAGERAKALNQQVINLTDTTLGTIRQAYVEQNAPPQPKVTPAEAQVNLGAETVFDASGSLAVSNATISQVQWALCNPSYRPAQYGVQLPGNAPGCSPMANYTATGNEFRIQTCNLQAGQYAARVRLTDSNNNSSAMDVLVNVLPPGYDDPRARLLGLKSSYEALQSAQFLSYFDESFPGYTQLQENVRKTMESLSSMTINLQVSQAEASCNEARVRADWYQQYTFRSNPEQRFDQTRQLAARMVRVPGRGWFITEFSGDNGTVQGIPPGPSAVDSSQPDIVLVDVQASQSATAAAAGRSVTPASAGGSGNRAVNVNAISVAPGTQNLQITLQNIGDATLTQAMQVEIQVLDASRNVIAGAGQTLTIPTPLPAGASTQIPAVVNIPDLGPGAQAGVRLIINPNCVVPERSCPDNNVHATEIIIGVIDVAVTALNATNLLGTQPGTMAVTVNNLGSREFPGCAGCLGVLPNANPALAAVPAIPLGGNTVVNVPITVPNVSGSTSFTAALTLNDGNTANNQLSAAFPVTQAVVNLQLTNMAFNGGNPPFVAGQSRSAVFTITNGGNVSAPAGTPFGCALVNSNGTTQLGSVANLPALAVGQQVFPEIFFTVPSGQAGQGSVVCKAQQHALEPANLFTDGSNEQSLAVTILPNVDLVISDVTAITGLIVNATSQGTVPVGVMNNGTEPMPAGVVLQLLINGVLAGTGTSDAPIAPGAALNIMVNAQAPSLAPPPTDAVYPTEAKIFSTPIPETNTTNNSVAGTIRIVDFTATALVSGNIIGVVGRPFDIRTASILPTDYPLEISVEYSGLPQGLIQSGIDRVTGTPTTPGSLPVTMTADGDGVIKPVGTVNFVILGDMNATAGATPTLIPNPQPSGNTQPIRMTVTGGIYPITLTASVPVGIELFSPASQTLTAPGTITWQIGANGSGSSGSGAATISITDSGSPATAPKTITALAPYNVAFIDLEVVSVGMPANAQAGSIITVPVTVRNRGNDASAATTVTLDVGTQATANLGSLTSQQITTLNIPVTIPSTITAPGSAVTNYTASIAGVPGDLDPVNNSSSGSYTVWDYTMQLNTGGVDGIVGRSFTVLNAVSIFPTNYPVPPGPPQLTITYNGLPTGLAKAGTFGENITGTPTVAGEGDVIPSGNADGVVKGSSGQFPSALFQIAPETTAVLAQPVTLETNGSPVPFTVNLDGGVISFGGTAQVTITLPTGITTTDPLTIAMSETGSVNWNLSATGSATAGTQNVTVTVVDNGIVASGVPGATIPFALPITVNGAATLAATNLRFTHSGAVNPATGANALVNGQSFDISLDITNSGNATVAGNVDVTFRACPDGCIFNIGTASVAAPGPGQTVTATFTGVVGTGATSGLQIDAIATAASPVSLASPITIDVFDFTVANSTGNFATQNVPLTGVAEFGFEVTVAGPSGPMVVMDLPNTPTGFAPTIQSPLSVAGSYLAQLTGNGTATGGATALTIRGIVNGFAKTATHNIQVYSAVLENRNSGQLGDSSSNAIPLTANGSPYNFSARLASVAPLNFLGSATLSFTPVAGYTIANLPATADANGDFTFDVSASEVLGVPKELVITATIPNTNPPQTVELHYFVMVSGTPDVSSSNITFVGSRDFNSFPLLAGEAVQFDVTVNNSGTGQIPAGAQVTVYATSGGIVGTATTAGAIAGGGLEIVRVSGFVPDPIGGFGDPGFYAQVHSEPDPNFQNNTSPTLTIPAGNWNLFIQVEFTGDQFNPVTVAAGQSASTRVEVQVVPTGSATAQVLGPIALTAGNVSTNLTGSFETPNLANAIAPSSGVTINAAPAAVDGKYLYQVIATLGNVKRSVTLYVDVGSGSEADSIIVTPTPNNLSTPLQLNGPLPATVSLEVTSGTCSGAGCGTVDLHFTDSGAIVTTVPATQQIKGMNINSTEAITVAAEEFDGFISTGEAEVLVSATAISPTPSAVRTQPRTDPVGNQITTLRFRIGDILVSMPSCNVMPVGGSVPLNVLWVPIDGFNAPSLSYTWTFPGALTLTESTTGSVAYSGGVYGSGSTTFTFNDNGTDELGDSATLRIDITNGVETVSKYFNTYFTTAPLGCTPVLVDGGGSANTEGVSAPAELMRGSWKRPADPKVGAVRGRSGKQAAKAAAMPDVRVDGTQVSYTPSLPKNGDTVNVRFRLTNAGNGNATAIPIALMVDGVIVAQDTFDVAAGKTALGGLTWKNAQVVVKTRALRNTAQARVRRAAMKGAVEDVVQTAPGAMFLQPEIALVVDPAKTMAQKSTLGKSYSLRGFRMRNELQTVGLITDADNDLSYIEVAEASCQGFRFSSGMNTACELADMMVTVTDMADGSYMLSSDLGVADLGFTTFGQVSTENLNFGMNVAAVAGHSYAVKLNDGRLGILTLSSIKSPSQLDAKARKIFMKKTRKIVQMIAGDSGSVETGDVSGLINDAAVYFEVRFRVQ